MSALNEIKIIKLVSGQEFIGKVVDMEFHDTEGWVEVEDLLIINIMPDETGNVRIALSPFSLFSTDKKVLLNAACILSIFVPIQKLIDGYRQQTSDLFLATNADLSLLNNINIKQ